MDVLVLLNTINSLLVSRLYFSKIKIVCIKIMLVNTNINLLKFRFSKNLKATKIKI